MGCFGLAIAGLLALAVPASIAPASLVGALVVIAVLGVLVIGLAYQRRRRYVPGVIVGMVVYAGIATGIHFAAR